MKKFTALIFIIITLMYAQLPKAEISIPCDKMQGFYFQPDAQDNVGHVTYMKISDRPALASDLTVINPLSYPQTVSVVGVMTSIEWAGGVADRIQMSFLVSVTNKQTVAMLLSGSMQNTEVEFDFNVYKYDQLAKTYFKAFYPVNNAHLLGLIEKNGSDLNIWVSNVADPDIYPPRVYLMTIGIIPQDITQQLLYAISSTQSIVKQWGQGIAPGIPVLSSPSNGSTTTDATPTFDWNDVATATSYTILVDNNSDFSSPEINQSPTLSTYSPVTNMISGTYFWKVKANNSSGSSDFTTSWTVTLNPPAPLPPGGIIIGPYEPGILLSWDDVPGATGYDIYSSDDPYGTYTFEAHITVSEYLISTDLPRRFYYIVSTN